MPETTAAQMALWDVLMLRLDAGEFSPKPVGQRPCPPEPVLLECPRGCGFITSGEPSAQWGPWRMQVHLMNVRCPSRIPGFGGTYRRVPTVTRRPIPA